MEETYRIYYQSTKTGLSTYYATPYKILANAIRRAEHMSKRENVTTIVFNGDFSKIIKICC